MVEMVIAEPGELSKAQLDAAEALVRNAFGSSFRPHDWLHAVEGVHVTLTDGDTLVAFAAIVARTLYYRGVALDTGYVEGVAVHADHQGRGFGRAVMDQAETVIHTRHQLGALNAVETAADFYAARGWKPWTGHTHATGPEGVIDTYDAADRIYLLDPTKQDHPLDMDAALICDWRPGDLW